MNFINKCYYYSIELTKYQNTNNYYLNQNQKIDNKFTYKSLI